MRTLHGTRLLAAVVFLAATLVLAVQLINPVPVQVSIGDDGSHVVELSNQFRYREVGVIAIAACLVGASGMYLAVSTLWERTVSPVPSNGTRLQYRSERHETPAANGSNPAAKTSEGTIESRQERLEDVTDRLGSNEETVYSVILDADGEIRQQKINDEVELSGATVSRTLDTLETKGLVRRERQGMGNVVVLEEAIQLG